MKAFSLLKEIIKNVNPLDQRWRLTEKEEK